MDLNGELTFTWKQFNVFSCVVCDYKICGGFVSVNFVNVADCR